MQPTVLASRAVLAEYARRLIQPFMWIGLGVLTVFIGLTIYLATQLSAWWWLLLIVVGAYGFLLGIGFLIIRFALARLRPTQSQPQRLAVSTFVDSAEKVSDLLQIGKFRLILRVIQDVISRNSTHNILSETAASSTSLKNNFKAVVDSFV